MGIKGPDFVMLACDSTHANQIIKLKHGNYIWEINILTSN